MKMMLVVVSITTLLCTTRSVTAQTQTDLTVKKSSPRKNIKSKEPRTRAELEAIFGVKGYAEILAGMRSIRGSNANTPEGKRTMETYALVQSADALRKAGRIEEANALYKKVATENAGQMVTAGTMSGMGDIAYMSGDKPGALAYYEDLIAPKTPRNWITSETNSRDFRAKYALLLQNAGRYDEAWEHYQYAMNVKSGWTLPKPPDVTREQVPTAQFVFAANLTVASEKVNRDNAQAEVFIRAAIKVNPTSGLPYYYLGEALIDSDLAGAKAAYEKAVRYAHGELAENAKRKLDYVQYELAKPQPAKPAQTVPTP